MSRDISTTGLNAIFAQEMSEVFLILLTISHPDLETPIYVSSDAVDTVSRGQIYIALPFDLTLPDENDLHMPRAYLTIDNVGRVLMAPIRKMDQPADVKIEIIRADDPDIVEIAFPDFKLTNIRYDAAQIQGKLSLEIFATQPYPAGIFAPSDFTGLM